jgi:hypothetical protein
MARKVIGWHKKSDPRKRVAKNYVSRVYLWTRARSLAVSPARAGRSRKWCWREVSAARMARIIWSDEKTTPLTGVGSPDGSAPCVIGADRESLFVVMSLGRNAPTSLP